MNTQVELMPYSTEEPGAYPPAPRPQAAMPAVMTPAHMLAIAVERGADIDQLQKFMDLRDRYEANEARKAFVAAMAKFKLNAPTILKDKQVSFQNSRGDTTAYKHATLFAVCEAALKGLAEVGISHRWIPKQEGDRITVTCELTHELGHSESVQLSASADGSGGKNSIQAVASTVSYLERYTLLAATGLATKDMDSDGNAPPDEPDTIGPGQVLDIEALMSEVNVNRENFLKFCKVERLEDIKLKNYRAVVSALEARRK